jgi:hypothetical protein
VVGVSHRQAAHLTFDRVRADGACVDYHLFQKGYTIKNRWQRIIPLLVQELVSMSMEVELATQNNIKVFSKNNPQSLMLTNPAKPRHSTVCGVERETQRQAGTGTPSQVNRFKHGQGSSPEYKQ